MEYIRITSINDPLFKQMHQLMQETFPPEEVLDFELWATPLKDPSIFVYVAVKDQLVVGITEYRYYPHMKIAMTDFTIVGESGQGIGPFLAKRRLEHLQHLAREAGKELKGMFAEIYRPQDVSHLNFGGNPAMHPFVRREVLAHLGYLRLDLNYVHPSWQNDGTAVRGLDLCFMPIRREVTSVPSSLVAAFLSEYYTVLPNKPQEWLDMIEEIKARQEINLLPI